MVSSTRVGLERAHGVTYSVLTHTIVWYTFRNVSSLSFPVKGIKAGCVGVPHSWPWPLLSPPC